jgi:hypothetical protein
MNTLHQDPNQEQDIKELAEALFPAVLEQIKSETPNMDEETQCAVARNGAMRRARNILTVKPPKKPGTLEESMASLGAKIAAREAEKQKQLAMRPAPPPAPAKIVEFPALFGVYTRAVSNPLARCSLFAPVKTRGHFKNWVLIATVDGVKIEAKGEQWNQDDSDVLAQFIKMAMHKPFGEEVSVYVKAVLYELGRHTQKSQRLQLYRELDRLITSSIKITLPNGAAYMGHIIESAIIPPDVRETLPPHLRRITYRLNKDFARFYDSTLYTLYDQRKRLQLTGRGSELAKWLHLWIEGNAEQYAHKVETLRDKSGSQTKDLKRFRFQLSQALDILKAAGIIESWYITAEDLVLINRTPSEAQQRHLIKKAAKEAAQKAAKKATKSGNRRRKPAHIGELL